MNKFDFSQAEIEKLDLVQQLCTPDLPLHPQNFETRIERSLFILTKLLRGEYAPNDEYDEDDEKPSIPKKGYKWVYEVEMDDDDDDDDDDEVEHCAFYRHLGAVEADLRWLIRLRESQGYEESVKTLKDCLNQIRENY